MRFSALDATHKAGLTGIGQKQTFTNRKLCVFLLNHESMANWCIRYNLTHMLTRQEIESLVLRMYSADGSPSAIQTCEQSADNAYWVVRANDARYALHGRTEFCNVGVNAYLVDASTGEIEVVGSACSVEQYLADKKDLQLAGSKKYVLYTSFDGYDPKWVIHLHRKIGCSLSDSRRLARNTEWWLTGKKSVLDAARHLFAREGIPVSVTLAVNAGMAKLLSDAPYFWDDLKKVLQGSDG